jgi:hypothetical protein
MATRPRAPRRADDAKQRRLRKDRARLEPEQRRAPRFLPALEQARLDLGRPATLAAEVEWGLKAHGTRLANSFGMRCPTRLGCQTADELTPRRGWDTHRPSRLLGALPTQQWLRRLQRRGHALLIRRWPQVEAKSPATRRRWPWTGGATTACSSRLARRAGGSAPGLAARPIASGWGSMASGWRG